MAVRAFRVTPAMRDFAIREIGCICCRAMGVFGVLCAKHHLLTTGMHGNGKRRGEAATIGLCDYHHQGAAVVGTLAARALRLVRGPSYADEAREFRRVFGQDDGLLAAQDKLIADWRAGRLRGLCCDS